MKPDPGTLPQSPAEIVADVLQAMNATIQRVDDFADDHELHVRDVAAWRDKLTMVLERLRQQETR